MTKAPVRAKNEAAATFVLMDDQQVSCSVQMSDDVGNPVGPVSGTPTWAVSDPTILALTVNTDGSATIASTAKLGTAQLNVSVPDPTNPTNPPLTGSLTINVTPSAATGITVIPGTPSHV